VALGDTAFLHRNAPSTSGLLRAGPILSRMMPASPGHATSPRSPYPTGGIDVNYADRDDVHRLRAAYGSNFERLAEIKARYDPDQVFSRFSSRD
jgi:hypothetical protein